MPFCFTAPFTEISGCPPNYCKFGYFRDNFIFANNIKIYVCDVKNSRLENDLPTTVNGSDFAIFARFYFSETSQMRSFTKINPRENF